MLYINKYMFIYIYLYLYIFILIYLYKCNIQIIRNSWHTYWISEKKLT